MLDGEYPVEDDLNKVTVKSAFTSIATFEFEDAEIHALEIRAFTIDGEEHHLIWPIETALPLLQSIMHVAMKVIGAPDIMGSSEPPKDIGDIIQYLNDLDQGEDT
jgi:hypothetical protein